MSDKEACPVQERRVARSGVGRLACFVVAVWVGGAAVPAAGSDPAREEPVTTTRQLPSVQLPSSALKAAVHQPGVPELYVANGVASPGSVFEVGVAPYPLTRFERAAGRVTALAVGPDGWLYYADASANFIFRTEGRDEYEVHRHATYVRDLAFDGAGRLYFSESSGAGGDGRIYRLSADHSVSEPFLDVPLSEVGGYWAGDFAFDPDGVLHVSSGNRRPASIYRFVNGGFEARYTSEESIRGFAFRSAEELLYASGSAVHLLTAFAHVSVEASDERLGTVEDVAVAVRPAGAGCTMTGRLVGGDALLQLAHVNAKGPDLAWRWIEGVRPGEDGRFALSGPPGRYWLSVDLAGDTSRRFEPVERFLDCQGPVHPIDFVLR